MTKAANLCAGVAHLLMQDQPLRTPRTFSYELPSYPTQLRAVRRVTGVDPVQKRCGFSDQRSISNSDKRSASTALRCGQNRLSGDVSQSDTCWRLPSLFPLQDSVFAPGLGA